MKTFHIVAEKDTLGHIARDNHVSLETLRKINGIKNVNRISKGQKIFLDKDYALGVRVLFVDTDSNPVGNVDYFLDYCGRVAKGKTSENGRTVRVITEKAGDQVGIVISRLDGTRKLLGRVTAGGGNKVFTVVMPRYRADAKSEPDSKHSNDTDHKTAPAHDKKSPPPPTTEKKDLGPKVTPAKTPDGRPVAKVEGDIANIDLFLDKYSAKEISDEDIKSAAKTLKCKPGLIFAIAKQESLSSSFFEINGRTVPKILYERHWFRKLTKPSKKAPSPYEEKYPDICGTSYHRAKKNKKNELIDLTTGQIARENDIYGPSGVYQYKRLLKAYQLDANAALQACSWGKFQIMGFNYKAAGFPNVQEFVKAMSRNDAEHIKAFLKFAASNSTLLSGLRNVNFEKIAEGHNGAGWKKLNPEYPGNIKRFYEEYVKIHGES